ncbi:GerAB/ArcD/ProY family transporter [Paenibacillus bouchesdurhonensis]|uniref:GerAB/ArcD/ProY family transporter n=1 Tax=Paenibacillus bouchesdurhonensis TaxID=1870990 RepID=UPI000DA5F169|nr:GerAB/ArcD/ProY family transporter [Paenibacillus bouchesdurhonensis]
MQKVTHLQIFAMYSLYIFTVTLAFMMGLFIQKSHFSTPVSLIAGGLLSIVLLYPAYKVTVSRPNETIIEYGGSIVGKVPHTIFVGLVAIINLLLASINFRELEDFLIQVYLPGTPPWVVALLFGICVSYGVRSGIITIFRASLGILLISMLAFIAVPFLVSQAIQIEMLPAFFNQLSLRHVGIGIYNSCSIFGEFAFLFLIMPYIKSPKKVYRTIAITSISSIIIILSHLLPALMILGPDLAANLTYPDLDLVRSLRISSFVETLDPILIVLWLTSLFIKISFMLFIAVYCISLLLKLPDHKSLALPFTAFSCILSPIFVRSQVELNHLLLQGLPPILLFTVFVIPTIYWITNGIKSRKNRTRNA